MKRAPHALCRRLLLAAILALLLTSGSGEATASEGQVSSTLDNGIVKVGIDLGAGGSISYLSNSGSSYNVVNSYDKGRYVQQSYYAGADLDRTAEGQSARWSPWPWNPIQAGDSYGNGATVLNWANDGTTIYVRTQPLLWDMKLEQCECYFETWIKLEGPVVHVSNRLMNGRTDSTWSTLDRNQELPAVYAVADLYRVLTYTGWKPFTNAPLAQIANSGSFWSKWNATEHWAACVNTVRFGIGVYSPPRMTFHGGLAGSAGGGVGDLSTCYMAPNEVVRLNRATVYFYDYYLAVGTVDQIRQHFYALDPRLSSGTHNAQTWGFNHDRNYEGWTPQGVDFPAVRAGSLNGQATSADPAFVSSMTGKYSGSLKRVVVRMSNNTPSRRAQLYFQTLGSNDWTESKSKAVTINPYSGYTTYTFDMSAVPEWNGTITRLRLDPVDASGTFSIDWIRIAPPLQ